MSNIYFNFVADSGGVYAATIERLTDGYFREDDAEIFGTSLAFADKDISLHAGDTERLGNYSGIVNAATWNDGLYLFRVHDTADQNKTVASTIFGVVDGREVSPGEETAIYHADIQFIRDSTNTQDEYGVTWFKNGSRVTSGITSPTIQVVKWDDGTDLIASTAMTEVGSSHTFKYTSASLSERQALGGMYLVIVTATIGGSSRSYSWLLGRDAS